MAGYLRFLTSRKHDVTGKRINNDDDDEIQPRLLFVAVDCSTKYVAVEVIDDGVSRYAEAGNTWPIGSVKRNPTNLQS